MLIVTIGNVNKLVGLIKIVKIYFYTAHNYFIKKVFII